MSRQSLQPLFRGLLGDDAFDVLPTTLRHLHLRRGHAEYRGDVAVVRGNGWLSRFCGWATRLPPAGTGPITVEILADDLGEHWIRHVAGHAMRSRLWAAEGLLNERLGLVDFGFSLEGGHGVITWTVVRVRAFGLLPLPVAWFSQVRARESEEDGRYRFEVTAALPLAGPLVHYRGWLEVP
jgi:hypothetical protein